MPLLFIVTAAALQPQALVTSDRRPSFPALRPARVAAAALEEGSRTADSPPDASMPSKLVDALKSDDTAHLEGALLTGRTRRVVRRVLSYVWPSDDLKARALISVSMAALVGAKVLNILVPIALKRAIDALEAAQLSTAGTSASAVMSVAGPILGAYVAARLGVSLANEARSVAYARVSQTATRAFSLDLFGAMHARDAAFHLANPTGALTTAFGRAVRGFQSLLFQLLYSILPVVLEVALTAGVLTRRFGEVGRAMCAVTLATFALYFGWTAWLVEWRVRLRRELNRLDSAKGSYLQDSLAGQETVKLFGNEAAEGRRFDTILRAIAKSSLRSVLLGSVMNAGQALIFSCGLLASMLLAARGLGSGALSIGDVVAVNALLLQLGRPMDFIGYTVSEVRQSLADMDAMTALIVPEGREATTAPPPPVAATAAHTAATATTASTATTATDTIETPLAPPEVRFEHVSYTYPNASSPALVDVSFVAPAGGTTVLVGGSGSGKSTTLRLITRLRDSTSGAIRLCGRGWSGNGDVDGGGTGGGGMGVDGGGVEVGALPLPALRRRIGFVAQEATIFDDSVGFNIRYGNLDASPERTHAAAAAASLTSTVRAWPDGLETRAGERGARLSGGEKQRVSVARALLRAPPLLLADEATSAADALTEAELVTALRSGTGLGIGRAADGGGGGGGEHAAAATPTTVGAAAAQCTLIAAAHRLSAIAPGADHIVVFKAGRVVEQGTHTELLARGDGEYRRLWRAQERE